MTASFLTFIGGKDFIGWRISCIFASSIRIMNVRVAFLLWGVLTPFFLCAQHAAAPKDTVNVAAMQFEQSHFNFHDIVQGTKVSHEYKFKNTGKMPLVISNVLVTCGCTVPEWPKSPVAPGKSASIRVFFNSTGKFGIQNKTITILANTKMGRETIVFTANVIGSPTK